MKKGLIDLHTHTEYSFEGIVTPALEVIEKARLKGVQTMAITDHNTTEGCIDVLEDIKKNPEKYEGFKFIPGIEITCDPARAVGYINQENVLRSSLSGGVHVLGYGINPYDERFRENARLYQTTIGLQTLAMYKFIHRYYGISVDKQRILNVLDDPSTTEYNVLKRVLTQGDNAPLTREMQKKHWWAKNITSKPKDYEAFLIRAKSVIHANKKNLFELEGLAKQDIYEMLHLIESSGGVAVLAHPTFYRPKRELNISDFELLTEFINALTVKYNQFSKLPMKGIVGIELLHGRTFDDQFRFKFYGKLAQEKGLFVTGGSDTHIKKEGREGYNNNLGYILKNYSIIRLDFVDQLPELLKSKERICNYKTVDEQASLFNDYQRVEPSEVIKYRTVSEKMSSFENEINIKLFQLKDLPNLDYVVEGEPATARLEYYLWLYNLYLTSVIKHKDVFFDEQNLFNNWLKTRQHYMGEVQEEIFNLSAKQAKFKIENLLKAYNSENDSLISHKIDENVTSNHESQEGYKDWFEEQKDIDKSKNLLPKTYDEILDKSKRLTNDTLNILEKEITGYSVKNYYENCL